jgi:hypothetical protein
MRFSLQLTLRLIVSAGVIAAVLSACTVADKTVGERASVAAVSQEPRLTQNLDTLFSKYQGKLAAVDVRTCLDNRRDASSNVKFTENPRAKPNHFLTCAANTTFYTDLAFAPDDTHTLIYEVTIVTKNPPADVISPSRLDGRNWDYTTHCAFHAKGGRIEAYDESRYGVFNIGALPSRMKPRDPCMQLPGAQRWINGPSRQHLHSALASASG